MEVCVKGCIPSCSSCEHFEELRSVCEKRGVVTALDQSCEHFYCWHDKHQKDNV